MYKHKKTLPYLATAMITLTLALTACISGGKWEEEPPPVVPTIEGFSLDKSKMALLVGMKEALLLPAAEQNKAVEWTSSNTNVASVATDGTVTAIAPGNANITVRTQDGAKTAACALTVMQLDSGLDLYVAGIEELPNTDPNSHVYAAVVWKNGAAQQLGLDGKQTRATSVFVTESDVYVAGIEYDTGGNIGFPVVWKNGLPQRLDSSNGVFASDHCWPNSIFVYGGDVYAAGNTDNIVNSSLFINAVLWKNGKLQPLSDVDRSGATSLYVSDGHVYVAGYENNERGIRVATVWKDGLPQRLSNGSTDATPYSIFVSGGDVYVVGVVDDIRPGFIIPTLWKNGVVQEFGDLLIPYSVFVSGNDVYIAGTDPRGTKPIATLWKNGVAQTLSNDWTEARSVFVSGNDVCVAGEEVIDPNEISSRYATLWINGHQITLNKDKKKAGYAYSVFVVK